MLYPTQEEILNIAKPNQIYALGVSSGKSLISLAHYKKFNHHGEPLLIVQPASKLKSKDWNREVERFSDYHNININYDQISYHKLSKEWQKYKGWFVIFDECHMIKTPTSNMGKSAVRLSKHATQFCLLSATPASNGYQDCINYFIMFGFTKNKTQFLNRFAIYEDLFLGTRTVKQVADFKDKHILKNAFNQITIQKPTEYFVDLPNVTEKQVEFKASTIYKKAKKDRVFEFENEEIILDTPSKLAASLRYLTNQKEKLDYTKMIFESTDENILIFTEFKRERDDLYNLAKDTGKEIYEITGKDTCIPERDTWQSLKNAVTIVNYRAGASAVELSYNDIIIYYTATYSYQDLVQSKGRAIRHKGRPHVTVLNYMTKGTIEEKVYQALKNKKDFTDELFSEYVNEVE